MQKHDWFEHGMDDRKSGDYYEVAEVDDKISRLESALEDANEDNSTLNTTIADLQDRISQLNSVLEEIQYSVRAAMR